MNAITVSATQAKLQFGALFIKASEGTPVIIEKNNKAGVVCISMDDYEDFLEMKDQNYQASIKKGKNEINKGSFGTLDNLYQIHKETIAKEAKK